MGEKYEMSVRLYQYLMDNNPILKPGMMNVHYSLENKLVVWIQHGYKKLLVDKPRKFEDVSVKYKRRPNLRVGAWP